MKIRATAWVWLIVAVAFTGGLQTLAAAKDGSAAGEYLNRLLDSIAQTTRALPEISALAEQAAGKLAEGGSLYLAGETGFIIEGLHRAGGMMTAKRLTKPEELSAGDVVLVGALIEDAPEEIKLLDAAEKCGAFAVYFAPANVEGSHGFVDAFAPADSEGEELPFVSPALAASLWAFTGELVSAVTRRGKMLPMYQSVVVPGGRERNASHAELQWEPGTPDAVEPLTLGRTYLARLANGARTLRARELGKFAQAGAMAAETIRAGGTVWAELVGHLPPYQQTQLGEPGIFADLNAGTNAERVSEFVKAGDLVLYVGYYEPFGPWVSSVHECGARIVTVVSGTPDTPAESMGADININGRWAYGDALVSVPGYDVDILPPSGVVQAAAYWMLVAATREAMAE